MSLWSGGAISHKLTPFSALGTWLAGQFSPEPLSSFHPSAHRRHRGTSPRWSHVPNRSFDSLVDTDAQSWWKLGYRLSVFTTFECQVTPAPLGAWPRQPRSEWGRRPRELIMKRKGNWIHLATLHSMYLHTHTHTRPFSDLASLLHQQNKLWKFSPGG